MSTTMKVTWGTIFKKIALMTMLFGGVVLGETDDSGSGSGSGSAFESGDVTTFAPTTFPTTLPTIFPTTRPTTFPTTLPTTYPTTRPTSFPTSKPTALPTTLPTRFPTTPAPTKVYKLSKFGCVDKLLPVETVAECEEAARDLDFVFESVHLDTQARRSKRPKWCYVNTANSAAADEEVVFNTKGKLSGYYRDYTSICRVDDTQLGGPDCVDTMLGCTALVKYGLCNYPSGRTKCAFTCGCKPLD